VRDRRPVDVHAHRAAGHRSQLSIPARHDPLNLRVVLRARPLRSLKLLVGGRRGECLLNPEKRRRTTNFFTFDGLERIFILSTVNVDPAAHAIIEEPHSARRLAAARVAEHADAALEVESPREGAVPAVECGELVDHEAHVPRPVDDALLIKAQILLTVARLRPASFRRREVAERPSGKRMARACTVDRWRRRPSRGLRGLRGVHGMSAPSSRRRARR